MVVGEPGIGKTALCEQLATYTTLRGGRTLVGHCYEEGSLSLPYLGFVEALRSYVLSRGADDLRKELGTGAAELLLNRFAGTSVVTSGVWYTTVIPRHLGGACVLLGRYEEARKYYDEAIEVCTEMRFRPELALTRLQLAELLLEHYPQERAEALEHLDFAIAEFRDTKIRPSLERALRDKEILGA